MIPHYPYTVVEEPEEKVKKPTHPVWYILHCISSSITLGLLNTYIHLFLWYGYSTKAPEIVCYSVYALNFACALTVFLFICFNPVDNSPTND